MRCTVYELYIWRAATHCIGPRLLYARSDTEANPDFFGLKISQGVLPYLETENLSYYAYRPHCILDATRCY